MPKSNLFGWNWQAKSHIGLTKKRNGDIRPDELEMMKSYYQISLHISSHCIIIYIQFWHNEKEWKGRAQAPVCDRRSHLGAPSGPRGRRRRPFTPSTEFEIHYILSFHSSSAISFLFFSFHVSFHMNIHLPFGILSVLHQMAFSGNEWDIEISHSKREKDQINVYLNIKSNLVWTKKRKGIVCLLDGKNLISYYSHCIIIYFIYDTMKRSRKDGRKRPCAAEGRT